MTDPLPEPDDPRELPTPPAREGRSAVVTPAMAGEANLARLVAASRRPTTWVAVGVLCAAFVGIGLWLGSSWQAPVGWLVGGLLVTVWIVARAGRKSMLAVYPAGTEVWVTTTPEGLRLAVPTGSYTLAWAEVDAVDLVSDHLVLHRRGGGGSLVVPPRLFGPETVEAVYAAINRQPGPTG